MGYTPQLTNLTAKTLVVGGDEIAISDSAASNSRKKITATNVAKFFYPKNYISGFTLSNNAGDAANDLDIAAGEAFDYTNKMLLVGSAMTKRLDAAWAAGTNQGGLDTGAEASGTWYSVWAVRKDSDASVDYLFSTSATAPTMPAGYTGKFRLGWIYNNGTSVIQGFTQNEDYFWWKSPIQDRSAQAANTNRNAFTVTVPASMTGIFFCNLAGGSSVVSWVGSTATTDFAPAAAAFDCLNLYNTSNPVWLKIICNVDASKQIAYRATNATAHTLTVQTIGYIDNRKQP